MDEEELQDFEPGEFSDLGDSQDAFDDDEEGSAQDGFEEEGLEEFDDEEDEDLLGGIGKRKAQPEAQEVIIDQKFFDRLVKQLQTNAGGGAVKLYLQVFSDLVLEQKKHAQRKRKFVAHELQLIDQVVRFTLEQFPPLLKKIVGFE